MKIQWQKITNIPIAIKSAELNIENLISELDITSDSIVGIVEIKLKPGVLKLRILWGDAKTSILDFKKLYALPAGPIEFLPNNYIRIKHVYDLPVDKKPFLQSILVTAQSLNGEDTRLKNLTISPRFIVFHTDVSFRLLHKGDSIAESTSEWSISANYSSPSPIKPTRTYYFEIGESITPTPWITLGGSNHAHELIAGESISTFIQLIERDPIEDDHYSASIYLDVFSENIFVTKIAGIIELKYTQNFQLIKPIQSSIPPLHQ